MNRREALQRLWWKEWRQLMPLVLMLLAGGLLFSALAFFQRNENHSHELLRAMIFVGVPTLFALSVGAVTISQEKETRTLGWVTQLPVSPRDIQRVKMQLGLVTLGIVWLVSLLLGWFVTAVCRIDGGISGLFIDDNGQSLGVINWFVQSLYLLLAGLAVAWRRKTVWGMLLNILPIAFLPPILAMLLDVIGHRWFRLPFTDVGLDASLLSICLLLATAVAYSWHTRSATQALIAETPEEEHRENLWFAYRPLLPKLERLQKFKAGMAPSKSLVTERSQRPTTPLSALVWQMATQNRMPLLAITALLTLGVSVASWSIQFTMPLLPITFLSLCLLGVLAFQGDRVQQRIRFLADRGVAPKRVWLSRHIAPAASFSFVVLIYLLFTVIFLYTYPLRNVAINEVGFEWVPVVVLILGLSVYATSQWVAQLVPSPLISVFAAPIFAAGALIYFAQCTISAGSPIIWTLIGSLLPMLATFHLMGRWMDNRLGASYWIQHTLWLFAVIVWPLMPMLYQFATLETMPSSIEAEIEEEAAKWGSYHSNRRPLTMLYEHDSESKEAEVANVDDEPLPLSEDADAVREYLRSQLESHPGAIEQYQRPLLFLLEEATVHRISLLGSSAENTDDVASVPETRRRYRESLELMLMINQRLRGDTLLKAQEMADILEISLCQEMLMQDAKARIGEPFYAELAAWLSDEKAREVARRRAIATSWSSYQKESKAQSPASSLGGYELPSSGRSMSLISPNNVPAYFRQKFEYRRTSRLVAHLWLAATYPEGATVKLRHQLASDWNVSPMEYGLGLGGDYVRADDVRKFLAPNWNSWVGNPPATQWRAGWEMQASSLLSSSSAPTKGISP